MNTVKDWIKKPQPQRCSLSPEAMEESFLSWFNNHMALLLMVIDRALRKKPPIRREETRMQLEWFLHALKHHYLPPQSSKSVRDARRYLKSYLRVYPEVNEEQSQKALEMIERIYQALGLRFRYQS